ncbi:MAG: rod shape-determining protein [Clostridia bacterium]|nr:rod shape-determining protein [Clostridia bacterium]
MIKLFINLDSYQTVIARDNLGIVLDEPTKILVEKIGNETNVKPIAFGQRAIKRNNEQYTISPILEGEIVDVENCGLMMKNYIERVVESENQKIVAYLNVPCGLTLSSNQSWQEVLYRAGVSTLIKVPAPIADMLDAGVDLSDGKYYIIIDIGAGSTDVAIVSSLGIIKGMTINIGAFNMDMAVVSQIQSKHATRVSIDNARELKNQIGTLLPNMSKNLNISGIDSRTGEEKTAKVTCFDILEALQEFYQLIMDTVPLLCKNIPDEIMQSVNNNSVIICGVGALIEGLYVYASERLKMDVIVTKSTENIRGLITLSNNKVLSKKML